MEGIISKCTKVGSGLPLDSTICTVSFINLIPETPSDDSQGYPHLHFYHDKHNANYFLRMINDFDGPFRSALEFEYNTMGSLHLKVQKIKNKKWASI